MSQKYAAEPSEIPAADHETAKRSGSTGHMAMLDTNFRFFIAHRLRLDIESASSGVRFVLADVQDLSWPRTTGRKLFAGPSRTYGTRHVATAVEVGKHTTGRTLSNLIM